MSTEKKIYECGTLRYSIGGLIFTTAMIMAGFFCLQFSSAIVGNAISIRIKDLGASDTLIMVILNTISGIFNLTVCPAVSFKSDRYRGKRWGRRIFFIISTLPMMCAAFLLFAFSGHIGNGITALIRHFYSVSPAAVTLGVIALIMVFYQFFRMFVCSVIYYIYNDVIPQQFLARVIGLVQVSTVAAGAIFNFIFLSFCRDYFTEVLVASAVIYAIGVGAMCLFVKEPVYPPLTEEEKKQSRGKAGILTFMRESFSHPFYWYSTVSDALWSVATLCNTFSLFFFMEMGLELGGIGKISGTVGLFGTFISMVIATVGAIFVDRWHPVRVNFYTKFFALLTMLLSLKWLFFTPDPRNFYWIYLIDEILLMTATYAIGISNMPKLMRTLPKSRFGQFCSAGAMFRSILVLVMGLVMGVLIDWGRSLLGGGEFVYRYIWVWRAVWSVISLLFLYLMYKSWQKLGGTTSYRAPAPWSENKYEEIENSKIVDAAEKPVRIGIFMWDTAIILYIAGAAGLAWYFNAGSDFMTWTLPGAAILICLYGCLRLKIGTVLRNDMKNIPHHGLLILTAAQQLLILGAALFQSFICGREAVKVSAQMYCFELIVGICAVLLLWASMVIERKKITE